MWYGNTQLSTSELKDTEKLCFRASRSLNNFLSQYTCRDNNKVVMETRLMRGFNSHPVHFYLFWKYSIEMSLILTIVGQIHQQYRLVTEPPFCGLISRLRKRGSYR